jgi:mono/diheme cytochrome c family protein
LEAIMKFIAGFLVGSIALPLLVVLAGVLGWLPSSATTEPPTWEASVAMRALDASLEKRSDGLSNPVTTKDKTALAAGAKIYAKNCAGCHGDAKGASSWGSKGFYPRAPQFFQEGTDVGPEEAYTAVHDGVRYSGMAAWRDLMKDDDIWKVANFVARIEPPKGGKAIRSM